MGFRARGVSSITKHGKNLGESMRGTDRTARISILVMLGVMLIAGALLPRAASALHDQGLICYICHSLNPADIRTGSNSIRLDQQVLSPVPKLPLGTSQVWSGGMPITCDFCHKDPNDVPAANIAGKAHHHPVRTIMDNAAVSNEIACADCHNGNAAGGATSDLTPASMILKSPTDGYPDHDNVTAPYAHTLAQNPPHLTVPYWGTALPGDRASDSLFWTAVRAGTQDIVCWICHESGRTNSPTTAPYTGVSGVRPVKGDYVGTDNTKGHKIRTTVSGAMQPGAALPCYDCHDSHGSVNVGYVLDSQSIYGASTAAVAVTTYTSGNDRVVCAQCHDTGNLTTSNVKSQPAQAGKQVEGMYVIDPFNSSATIHSVAAGFADNMGLGTKNCLAKNAGCHASPHNPIGESQGGQNCGVCHSGIYAAMQSNTGYHHVMASDNAPVGNAYPNSTQPAVGDTANRRCTMCHADHNYFSKQVNPAFGRSENLRRDVSAGVDNTTNKPISREFDNTLANGGICTSCHANTQAKSGAGVLKQDGSTTTPVVSKSYFSPSAHNYGSTSPFIQSHFQSDNVTTNFNSNCTKCHNDTLGVTFQDNTTGFQFALHASSGTSAANKILAPLGITAPFQDNLSESFCYRCHSKVADAIGGSRKKLANGKDWYNNANMDNAAESTYGVFQRLSRHPVSAAEQVAGTKVVDCLNCHNVHLTRSATGGIVANPDNTYAFDSYVLTDNSPAGKANRSNFCLKCHDGGVQAPAGLPSYTVTTGQYVPYTVYAAASSNNKYTNGARGHWSASGQLDNTTKVACDACHDKHGSTARKLLGVFDNNDGVNRINGVAVSATVTAADNAAVCYSCHTAKGKSYADNVTVAAYEAFRDGTGYFSPTPSGTVTTVRWPGKAAYDCTATVFGSKQSPHGNTSATGPSSLGSRAVADCNGCHDPHGTAYTYNMLTDNMTATSFKLCFDCHGLAGSPSPDNIARHYPTGNGGLSGASTSSTNVGHNIKTSGGYLSVGNGLPCYDCHMTHGSTRGNSQLKSDQRWTGLGNTKYGATSSDNVADNNSRTFCLGCHVASDDAATTGTVENMSRQGANRLRLPQTNAIEEHKAGNGQGCHRCHYGLNYTDNTYGPHWPATGLCDTCHESQGTISASAATYNAAHEAHARDNTYKFACKQCHSWTATLSKATHKNDNNATQHAEVRFDNQATGGWSFIQYGTGSLYEYRSIYNNPFTAGGVLPTYVSGPDNATADSKQASVRWTNGTCGTVWCHSNANPIGGLGATNVYQSPTWLDNGLGADTCTGCHGGDWGTAYRIGDNTSPLNGSRAHFNHIKSGRRCVECHYKTIKSEDPYEIDYNNPNRPYHVNGQKDVTFPPSRGGTWDNNNKTCSATWCHGTPAILPKWDNVTADQNPCNNCHQAQGIHDEGTPQFTFFGAHGDISGPGHTINIYQSWMAGGRTYRFACEVCHTTKATDNNTRHMQGDVDNAATPQYAEVSFTDNASVQYYFDSTNGNQAYRSYNMRNNPFLSAPAAPTYAAGPAYGLDVINPSITTSQGTCSTVWCHSNANPLTAAGAVRQNKYRSPQWIPWALPGFVACTPCHSGANTAALMGADNTNLSAGHVVHVATDNANAYGFTCDECHAMTAANDCTVDFNGPTGIDNHVNGIKSVFFSTTLRTTTINQSGGTYDNAAPYQCTNTYCHSDGTDNNATGGFSGTVKSPRWDNVNVAGCAYCHGYTAASGTPIVTNAHDNHVSNAAVLGTNYTCNRCHDATVTSVDNAIKSRALHVNGYRNVAFSDNASTATYTPASVTCSNTFCHRQGNKTLTGGADNLSIAWDCTVNTDCKTCHGSKTGGGYSAWPSLYGEPNYDNGTLGTSSQNSHGKHMRLPGANSTTFCYKCHATTADNLTAGKLMGTGASHLNDNVDVTAGVGTSFGWTSGTHTCSNISCHGGTGANAVWGASLNCSGCHVSFGIENWTYNTGSHRMHTDNTQYKVACETCHAWKSTVGNVVHGSGDNNAGGPQYVEIRFTDNASAAQRYSTNPTNYISDNLYASMYGRTWSPTYAASGVSGGADNLAASITWSTGTCNNVYCHSNAAPLGSPAGAVIRTQPAWGSTYGCTVCHSSRDNNATMLADNNNLSKVHAQHVATDLYSLACFECHGSTVNATDNIAAYDNHVNGVKNWRFSSTFKGSINQVGGTYAGGGGTCANLYCHSRGTDNATFVAPVTVPRWDNTGNTGCIYCHGGTQASGTPMATVSHDNHVIAGPIVKVGFPCERCHFATVNADNTSIKNYSLHVNGYKNVVFNSGTGTYDVPNKTCNNSICHQQGQPLLGANDNIPIRWDNVNELVCKRCHGSRPAVGQYGTSYWGEPNYDNNIVAGARNSHRKHVYSLDTTKVCALCHPGVSSTTDNTFNANTTHVNDNVEVQQGTGVTFTWNPGTHQCSNISCHGGAGANAVWGAVLNCQNCHVGSGDRNDYAVNDCAARIDNAAWQSTGHGRTTAFNGAGQSNNPAANDGTRFGAAANPNCINYCHTDTIGHAADNSTVNFFRLATGTGGTGRTAITPVTANNICKQCHTAVGAYTAQATRDVVTAHYGSKHSMPDNNGGYFCWDCHEPHGDNNAYMIHATPAFKTDNATGPGKPLGTKAAGFQGQGAAGVFVWGDYVRANPNTTGICQVCHGSQVNYFDNATKYVTTHNPGTRCTQCHGDTRTHDINFRGIGTCIGCHNAQTGSSPTFRRQVTGATGGDFDNGNAPTHHIANYFDNTAAGAVQNIDCSKCHWEGWLTGDPTFGATLAQGDTNPGFHHNDNASASSAVQLRVWSGTSYPTTYNNSGTGTAIEWRPDNTWLAADNAIVLNRHCLGCHSSAIGAATPFSDGRSPRVRSWDGLNVATKYLRNGTTNTRKNHPYSNTTYNVVPQINKALSAHFDLQNNIRGVATTGAWANDDASGVSNTATGSVACFDCHNSHASKAVGVAGRPLVSYANNATLNGGLLNSLVGGLLKETTAGESGYKVTYQPSDNSTHNWSASAAMCFDCHVGASRSGVTPPKSYVNYGRTAANIVAGYYDPVQWRTSTANRYGDGVWNTAHTWEGSFAFKDNTIKASHFKNDAAIRALQTTPTNQLNGMCTPCHDPHGVTTNATYVPTDNYATPLLKGTWMTSPYFEDRPGNRVSTIGWNMNAQTVITINTNVYNGFSAKGPGGPRMIPDRAFNRAGTVGGGYGTTGGGSGNDGFFIDENTFGLTMAVITPNITWDLFANNTLWAGANANYHGWNNLWNGGRRMPTITINRIGETNTQFAGLCERCHTPSALVNTASKAANIVTHAHITVKGYRAAVAGAPAGVDIVKSISFGVNLNNQWNNSNNAYASQRLLGAWVKMYDTANSPFSDYRFVEDPNEPWSGFPFFWGLNLNLQANIRADMSLTTRNATINAGSGQFLNGYVQTDYHQFPCSKCHAVHTSRLPRLLKTNCLDVYTTRGVVGGVSNAPTAATGSNSWYQPHSLNTTNNSIIRMRATSNTTYAWTPARAVRCHQDGYMINGTAANDTRWNDITPW